MRLSFLPANTIWLKVALLTVVLVAGFLAFYNLGASSFGHGDQTIHSKAVQEMVYSGDFITPRIQGRVYYNKPPFKMWLAALSVKFLGESNFSYRFIDGCVGVLLPLLIFFFALKLYHSILAASLSAFALLGANMFFHGHGVRNATQDTMLLLLFTIAIYFAWRFFTQPERRIGSALLGGGALGLSVMTKGVAAGLILPIMGLYALCTKKVGYVFRRESLPALLLIVFLTLLPISVFFLLQGELAKHAFSQMILNEGLNRATGGYQALTNQTWYFFKVIFEMREMVVPELLVLAFLHHLWLAVVKRDERSILLLLWSSCPVILHSMIRAKLSWYVMPALPGMALLVGYSFAVALSLVAKKVHQLSREFSAKILLVTALGVVLCVYALYLQGSALARIFRKVTQKPFVHQSDTLTREILEESIRRGVKFRVAREQITLAFHEPLYWRMVGLPIRYPRPPLTKREKKLYTPEKLAKKRVQKKLRLKELLATYDPAVPTGEADIILTNPAESLRIVGLRPSLAHCSLRPANTRRGWMRVLIYIPGFVPKGCLEGVPANVSVQG